MLDMARRALCAADRLAGGRRSLTRSGLAKQGTGFAQPLNGYRNGVPVSGRGEGDSAHGLLPWMDDGCGKARLQRARGVCRVESDLHSRADGPDPLPLPFPQDQSSSGSMIVMTRVVTCGSPGSSDPHPSARS